MRACIFLILFLFVNFLIAQETRNLVWEHDLGVQYQPTKNLSFNTSIAKRTSFLKTENGKRTELSFLEINQFITRKINPTIRLSIGYKYRTTDPVEKLNIREHRITEQITYTHLDDKIRLVSRLRLEQRIMTTSFAHRYRYRISADLPLAGETLNENEFYLVGSNELLFEAVDVESNTWENRINGSIGYVISAGMRAQVGITYRLEDLNIKTVGVPFINSSLMIKLD